MSYLTGCIETTYMVAEQGLLLWKLHFMDNIQKYSPILYVCMEQEAYFMCSW